MDQTKAGSVQIVGSHVPVRVTVHCTATKNGLNVSIPAIEADHISRGFGGIGYHGIVQADGTLEKTRSLTEIGCHVGGSNAGNLGIALAGTDRFTKAQFTQLKYTLDGWFLTFGIQKWEIYGHRDWPSAISQGKTCPGIMTPHLLVWYLLDDPRAIQQYVI